MLPAIDIFVMYLKTLVDFLGRQFLVSDDVNFCVDAFFMCHSTEYCVLFVKKKMLKLNS